MDCPVSHLHPRGSEGPSSLLPTSLPKPPRCWLTPLAHSWLAPRSRLPRGRSFRSLPVPVHKHRLQTHSSKDQVLKLPSLAEQGFCSCSVRWGLGWEISSPVRGGAWLSPGISEEGAFTASELCVPSWKLVSVFVFEFWQGLGSRFQGGGLPRVIEEAPEL